MQNYSYALITAAKNEEGFIERTIKSIVNQTWLPKIWVIVSDGSTDCTDELVMRWSELCRFIRLLRIDNQSARAFSSQAFATNAGYESIKDTEFDFIGFLDADISVEPSYYEALLKTFRANPQLGVAGGEILERRGKTFEPRVGNSDDNVAGAIQFFRRQCYEDIGGNLIPLQYGGHDFVANAMARRAGWLVRSIPGLPVLHHRPTGTAGAGPCRARFRIGLQDYFLGYQPLFALGKCVRRISHPPIGLGSIAECFGYLLPWLTRKRRTVPDEFVRYLRQQQLQRVFHSAIRTEENTQAFRKSA